jgi:hypothetical protein
MDNKTNYNKKVLKSGLFPGDWILLKAVVLTVCALGLVCGGVYGGIKVGKEAAVTYQIFYEIAIKGTTAIIQEIHTTTTPGIPVEIVTEILTLIENTNMSAEEQMNCLIAIKKNLIAYKQINQLEIVEAQRLQQLINLFDSLAEDQHEAALQLQKFLKQLPKTSSDKKGFIE